MTQDASVMVLYASREQLGVHKRHILSSHMFWLLSRVDTPGVRVRNQTEGVICKQVIDGLADRVDAGVENNGGE